MLFPDEMLMSLCFIVFKVKLKVCSIDIHQLDVIDSNVPHTIFLHNHLN